MAARFRNEKYYRKLSKKERREFRLNCDDDPKDTFKDIMGYDFIDTFKDIMGYDFINIEQFIGGAFLWDQTPQGHNYWLRISERYNS